MTDASAVRGVVLAGGASTRFGAADKALARLDGRPLVAHVVAAVDAATEGGPLLAVADDEQGERLRAALAEAGTDGGSGLAVETVLDVPDLSGPLAGIFAAVARAETERLFVCACDMPLVTPAGIRAVCRAASDVHRSPDADETVEPAAGEALVPVVDGYDQPLHAAYRRGALERARSELTAGDAIMALLDELRVERVDGPDLHESLPAATTNVNTRADLAAVRNSRRD